jgi:hypothetical protein
LPKNSNSDLLDEYGRVAPSNSFKPNVGRDRRAV